MLNHYLQYTKDTMFSKNRGDMSSDFTEIGNFYKIVTNVFIQSI